MRQWSTNSQSVLRATLDLLSARGSFKAMYDVKVLVPNKDRPSTMVAAGVVPATFSVITSARKTVTIVLRMKMAYFSEGRHTLPPTPAATALTPPRRRPHSSGVTQLLRRTRMKRNNVVKAGSKTATRLSVLGRIKLEPGYKAPPVFDEVLPHGQVFSCTALYRSLFMGEVKVGALYDWDGHCTLTRAREYRMRP